MDSQSEAIIQYSKQVKEKLTAEIREEIKKRIADSFLVSYGARDSNPVRIEKESLLPSSGNMNSTIYFTDQKASVDISTFINGSMTRYLDYNDTYLSREALHPSDNIPPMIAVGEATGANGTAVINSVSQAYAVLCALADSVSIRDRGWDHVTYISISAAAGLANLLDYDDSKYENTVNLGINNNISMRQTRAGELSMWKGCTAANASRNSVIAALLAGKGFTGPSPIFQGEMGFFKQVSGEFSARPDVKLIMKTMIKNYPVEYHAMSAAEASVDLRNEISGEINNVEVDTFRVAYQIIVKDPEKWNPKTKETADHSLPYIIAYTLNNGAPDLHSYDDSFLNDPSILDIMSKMKIEVTDEFNSLYPEYLPVSIRVKTSEGTYEKEIKAPKGHHKNPYSWDDLTAKGERIMGRDKAVEIISAVRSMENRGVSELLEVLRNVGP